MRTPPPLIDCNLLCNTGGDLLSGWAQGAALRASPTAAAMLAELDAGWTMAGADLSGQGYEIDAGDRTILIDTGGLAPSAIARSRHFQNTLTLRLLAAIRAAWQADRADDALALHRVDLWPLLGRVFEADVAAMTVCMAWELRAEGDNALWHHALADECGDMAACYARADKDNTAMALCFRQWFERGARLRACDGETLALMDAELPALTMEGRGHLAEAALKCLTLDPLSGRSYLGALAAEIAGNPSWRGIPDPVAEAHFTQIVNDIGATRIGHVAMRDAKLAARLFPGMLAADADICVK